MAMAACRECKKPVSTEAKTCPSCGVANPTVRPTSGLVKGALVLVGAIILAAALNSMKDPTPPQPPPPKTPEQIKQDSIVAAAKARKNAAFDKVAATMAAVKKALREPDSVVWEMVRANEDATVICLEYRARNGFGGMNYEHATVRGTSISREASTWKTHCSGALPDFTYAKHAL